MDREFRRAGDPALASFLQHVATLVGTNPPDRDGLARAVAQSARVDDSLIAALAVLAERYVTLASSSPGTNLTVVMRGHLRILEHLILSCSPANRRSLRSQADHVRDAMENVLRIVR